MGNANVFDVAKYILDRLGAMSTWKLQKLCYYAQAWSLAWTGKPLFPEEFEAWANGPVCRELFNIHKGLFIIDKEQLSMGNPNNLSSDETNTIDIVLNDYGNFEPFRLREISHSEDPWIIARNGCLEGERCENIITKQSIGEYYGSL